MKRTIILHYNKIRIIWSYQIIWDKNHSRIFVILLLTRQHIRLYILCISTKVVTLPSLIKYCSCNFALMSAQITCKTFTYYFNLNLSILPTFALKGWCSADNLSIDNKLIIDAAITESIDIFASIFCIGYIEKLYLYFNVHTNSWVV